MINSELHGVFCRQMKAWREDAGITQCELARRLKVKPSVVSQLESGRNAPTVDTVSAVAKALGVPLKHFLFADPARVLASA